MSEKLHPAAPHHLPGYITAPGETDTLYVIIVVSLLCIILLIGNFYFKLHALPEKMAHRANSTQLQLVGILALLAMFTHINLFWVAALLIAAVRLPDLATPLRSIANSIDGLTARIDGSNSPQPDRVAAADSPAPPVVTARGEPGDTDLAPATIAESSAPAEEIRPPAAPSDPPEPDQTASLDGPHRQGKSDA